MKQCIIIYIANPAGLVVEICRNEKSKIHFLKILKNLNSLKMQIKNCPRMNAVKKLYTLAAVR